MRCLGLGCGIGLKGLSGGKILCHMPVRERSLARRPHT